MSNLEVGKRNKGNRKEQKPTQNKMQTHKRGVYPPQRKQSNRGGGLGRGRRAGNQDARGRGRAS